MNLPSRRSGELAVGRRGSLRSAGAVPAEGPRAGERDAAPAVPAGPGVREGFAGRAAAEVAVAASVLAANRFLFLCG